MILLFAVLAGLVVGVVQTRWHRQSWQLPELHHIWLIPLAFLPQLLVFYLPGLRTHLPNVLVAACLIGSQIGLLVFCLLNRNQLGIVILAAGLLLNLLAILANGGFMPLGTDTAAQLFPEHILHNIQVGRPLGAGSKDILLSPDEIVFPWLADRFLPPAWFPYRFAFSIGDVSIALGAFLLLGIQPSRQKGSIHHVSPPDDQYTANGPTDPPGTDRSEPPARSGVNQQPVL